MSETISNADMAVLVAEALCRRFEGFYSKPYLCSAGVPTIGYGATYYRDGRRVTLKDAPITHEQALDLLRWMLRTVYLPTVHKHCPNITDPSRLAAIVDWVFNLGERNLAASTLRRKINADDWDAVPVELMKWVNGGGRRLPGLVKRREAECQLI